jgi:IS5 family transposase
MRPKFKSQQELDYASSNLKVTNEYYAKYEKISQILDENPGIVEAVHGDLTKVFGGRKRGQGGRRCDFPSETVLRVLIVKQVEGLDYRDAVVRVDDSAFLRKFVKIDNGLMMDFTTLCKMFKAIRSQTWKKVNEILKAYALEAEKISGEQLRRDTTVYEANIHYPTDSSLMWDTYNVLGRFIERVREVDSDLVGEQRLRTKDVKKIYFQINRQSSKKKKAKKWLKSAYRALLGHVEKILAWADEVCDAIRRTCKEYTFEVDVYLRGLVHEYEKYIPLGLQVMNQAERRVLHGESVPNDEKIFSIFEPHVELIIRGKAGKDVEFGHVVNLQQVSEKFITGYDVFEKKPVEHELVDPTLDRHLASFGAYPEVYSDDKGAYESMDKLRELEESIRVVGICKKGKRNAAEEEREHAPAFKLAQKFRAGIEGTISFLKRVLGLGKCMYRSFQTFKASVGCIVFAHNLLVLARL